MKKSLFLTIAALLFGIAAYAQQPVESADKAPEMPTAEQIAQRRADRLKKQLLLGQDQYKKVYKLCLEQAEKDVERMKQLKAEKESMQNAMKGILNDAQYERFEQMQDAPRQGRFQHQRGMHHPQKPCGEKVGKCPEGKPCCNMEGKPCCDKGGKQAPQPKAGDGDSTRAGESKYKLEKGQRMRMVGDPRRNQNAYNYIEGAAEN